jgi:hypothetical protein
MNLHLEMEDRGGKPHMRCQAFLDSDIDDVELVAKQLSVGLRSAAKALSQIFKASAEELEAALLECMTEELTTNPTVGPLQPYKKPKS